MKKQILLLVFCMLWACSSEKKVPEPQIQINSIRDYIGLQYGPANFFENHNYQGGTLLDSLNGTEYSITHVSKDEKEMLWLERLVRRDKEGNAYWEIRDVLELPAINENETLIIGICKVAEVRDLEVIAIGQFSDVDVITTFRCAWRANRKIEKFQEIETNNITCLNEFY